MESGDVFGFRKIHEALQEASERCRKHRVAQLMRKEGIRAQTGYGRRPRAASGKPSVIAQKHLAQKFNADAPSQTWVTDSTYIRTHGG